MRSQSNVSSIQTGKQPKDKADELVNQSFKNAKQLMAKSGYKIPDNVKVTVDPELPFMGYTMPTRLGFNIVVSGGAVGSGMLEGLLVHEMSHIYRIQSRHPSHNSEILEEAIGRLVRNRTLPDYQQKIIHDLLNDIQDLYADDISFKILRASPVLSSDQMTEFLQSWVKDRPVNTEDLVRDRWTNASLLAHNARAIAQMERHRVEDTDRRAARANQAFLEDVSPRIAREFDYFRKTLANLRENMTADEYRTLLAEYLHRFVSIAEKD